MTDSLVRDTLRSASSLMGLQLFSRLFTFALNQVMVRLAPPRAYGTAAIQFELLLSTILFLSREGVRNALLRVKIISPAARNVSVLPILLGFPLALATAYGYASLAGDEVRSQKNFIASVTIYVIAALLELMSEPMHNLAMSQLHTGVRVRAEGLGITSKSVVTFLVLVYDYRSEGDGALALIAFAGGQLAYGAVVLVTYVAAYGAGHWRLERFPSVERKTTHYFDPDVLHLSLTMTSQSIVKHFLTEGDKLILSWFSPLQDQAGYALAANYGSLIARIVFQPIEEASRGFFSKALGARLDRSGGRIDNSALRQAAIALESLLSVQAVFSIMFVVFGRSYLSIALQILLPKQYLSTSAPQVLSAWIWYIPVLAFNGGLEAFLSSVANPRDLNKQSWWMALFSMAYIGAAVSFFKLGLGDASLVYANILNLSLRIVYTAVFISSFYTQCGARPLLRWRSALPPLNFLYAIGISHAAVWASAKALGIHPMLYGKDQLIIARPVLYHIGTGIFMALLSVAQWFLHSGFKLYIPHVEHPKSQ